MKPLIPLICIVCLFSCSTMNEADKVVNSSEDLSSFEKMTIPKGFNFETLEEKTLQLDFSYNIEYMQIEIYTSKDMNKESLYFRGGLNKDEIANFQLKLPTNQKKVWVKTNTPSIQSTYEIPFSGQNNKITLSPLNAINEVDVFNTKSNGRTQALSIPISTRSASWNNEGVPSNLLSPDDTITQDFIDDITASLPNSQNVTVHSPDYINEQSKDINLVEEADVYITFFHENASYRNSLCFYVYDTSNPPTQQSDIDSVTVVFPNTSLTNSGGDLSSGNKVLLGRFSAGKSIGFVLLENGWQNSLTNLNVWGEPKFSNLVLNNYTTGTERQHMVALADVNRERIILGFEDVSRQQSHSDEDFNDVIFYATATPYTAISNDFPSIKDAGDNDGDGVINENDEFPDDPERSYIENIPNTTLAFEDNWPDKGDYDFNDLVLNCSIQKVLNHDYKIKDINIALTINAVGGYYHNGFGFEWPIANSKIQTITGQNLSKGITTNSGNGTEIAGTNAVIIAFEDAYSLMSPGPGENVINVIEGGHYVDPYTQNLSITFVSNQVNNNEISSLSNPFIFVNQDRGREVHLPNKNPTLNFEESFFGTSDDVSSVKGSTYKTVQGAPWAIEIPGEFKYPEENVRINDAFSSFTNWVETAGVSNQAWYDDKSSSLLYNKK